LRTTVASADIGDISLSLPSSDAAFSLASFGIPAAFMRCSSSASSFGASSISPSSFWIAFICSFR